MPVVALAQEKKDLERIPEAVRQNALEQENNDLERIPEPMQQNAPGAAPGGQEAPPAPPPTAHGRYYLEDAPTWQSLRAGLVVPFPPPRPFDWQNRTSFDVLDEWKLGEHLTASLSNRYNLTEESDLPFPTHQNIRNDFREGYLSFEAAPQTYLESGRINVRNGVALGFNPTDFFKTRTLLDQASLDPSVIREDRLGTFMTQAQRIWEGGSASIVLAPKFYDPTPFSTATPFGWGPKFDRTNSAYRLLVTANYDIAGLSPQILFYHESDQLTRLGLNLSKQLGQSVIAYAEWAGGRQPDLVNQAIIYGKHAGVLPLNVPTLLPTDAAKDFRNDAAIGASWTSSAKVTINLEYHYHQAGFSNQDWRNWFAVGSARRQIPGVANELWFFRGYAADQQQPMTRQQVFVRANWTDAFISKLELSAFAFVDLYDGSVLTQSAAVYYLSDAWTVGGYIGVNAGGARSERGSLPQAASAILSLVRYF